MGRYSNGPVWVERLAELLEVANPLSSERGGTNYAWGGATTGSIVGDSLPDMDEQVRSFLSENMPRRGQLFVLLGGANDFSLGQPDAGAPARFMGQQISDLASAGGQPFLVGNMPHPLSPEQTYIRIDRRCGLWGTSRNSQAADRVADPKAKSLALSSRRIGAIALSRIGVDDILIRRFGLERRQAGFGYGDVNDLHFVGTVLNDTRSNYNSPYVRQGSTVDNPNDLSSLKLHIDYDDAFIANINGVEVARSGVGAVGEPVAHDTAMRILSRESSFRDVFVIDLAGFPNLLTMGDQNVLAIQGINRRAIDNDFVLAQLRLSGVVVSEPTGLSLGMLGGLGKFGLRRRRPVMAGKCW